MTDLLTRAVAARMPGITMDLEFFGGLLDAEFSNGGMTLLIRPPGDTLKEFDAHPIEGGLLLCVAVRETNSVEDNAEIIHDLVKKAREIYRLMRQGVEGPIKL